MGQNSDLDNERIIKKGIHVRSCMREGRSMIVAEGPVNRRIKSSSRKMKNHRETMKVRFMELILLYF